MIEIANRKLSEESVVFGEGTWVSSEQALILRHSNFIRNHDNHPDAAIALVKMEEAGIDAERFVFNRAKGIGKTLVDNAKSIGGDVIKAARRRPVETVLFVASALMLANSINRSNSPQPSQA